MFDSKDILFRLLRSAFAGVDAGIDSAQVKWAEVIDMAMGQGVLAMAFEGLQKLPKEQFPDIDNFMEMMGQSAAVESKYNEQLKSAVKVADLWHDNGIRTLVLKGFAFSEYYPVANHRPSSDMDCYVAWAQDSKCDGSAWETANQLIEQQGRKVCREDYRHSTFDFGRVHVENHRICTTVRGKKQRKVFERYLRSLLENEGTRRIGDSHLEIPCDEFNALYFLQHAHRHFLREGITLRYVCDWAMMVRNAGCFDEEFWNVCGQNDIRSFAESLTRLAYHVCGVRAAWLNEDIELLPQDKMLLEDCFRIGDQAIKYGNALWAHLQMARNMIAQRWKYRYFSEDSFLRDIITSAWSVQFEKNPEV